MGRGLPKSLGGVKRCGQDRYVAGTAAKMTAKKFAQLRLRGLRMRAQIGIERHQDAGGAEAALQRVMSAECLLQHGETARFGRERLDRADGRAIGLYGERKAGACRHTVNPVSYTHLRAHETRHD